MMRNRQTWSQCSASSQENNGTCPICNGVGFITTVDEDGHFMAESCKCRDEEIRNRRKKFAEIPEAFRDNTIDTFDVNIYKSDKSRESIEFCMCMIQFYLKNFEDQQESGMGLYLFSNTKGSGKTRMAASIANELLKDHQVKFATSQNILAEIKKTYERKKKLEYDRNNDDERTETESQVLDYLITSEILIIDDFGTERITGWANEKFYQIINERYISKKVTIFTSNEDVTNTGYDTRITNRIQERTYPIRFPEESVREILAENRRNDFMMDMLRG